MLYALKDLQHYALQATDDTLGTVKDIYFDDSDWSVRYLVANSGGWLFGREVLLSVSALGESDPEENNIAVALTKQEIKNAPSPATHLPVSERGRDAKLPLYISSEAHTPFPTYMPMFGMALQGRPYDGSSHEADLAVREAADPHLRSADDLCGYAIHAKDGNVGSVADVIVDQNPWRLRYMVVDTAGWFSERLVVLGVDWITSMDWHEREIVVPVTKQRVEDSPPLKSLRDLDRPFEQRLHEAFGFPLYWR